MPPKTYTEVHDFLCLVGHYRRFIKGFAGIEQLLNKHLTGEGASRKSDQVTLSEDALNAFKVLKQACMTAPVLAFADYTKPFLLETDASKDGLGAVLSQKQADGWYHPVAYSSRALMPHKKNYHLTKLEFLALKWVVTEHFKEYLLYQPFLVKTNNNPLTYIMTTPNLDGTGHQWVRALAQFTFKLEYHNGHNNTVEDVLSQVTTQLDPDTVRSILDGVVLGAAYQAKVHDSCHSWGWPKLGAKGACHHRPHAHTDACHWLGWSPKGGPNVVCSFRLAEGTKEDRFQGTSGRTCLQQGRSTDPTKSTEFNNSSGSLVSALNAQRQDQRYSTFHSP